MTSLILRTASRFLITLLMLYSIFMLLRGHNAPGGGFVGGLVAASAWVLYGIAFGERRARTHLIVDPRTLIVSGLVCSIFSGMIGAFGGGPFLTGKWVNIELGAKLDFGTPLLFDLGVYLVVLGTALTIVLVLAEEN